MAVNRTTICTREPYSTKVKMALSLLTLQFRIIGPKYELGSNSELTRLESATRGPCS